MITAPYGRGSEMKVTGSSFGAHSELFDRPLRDLDSKPSDGPSYGLGEVPAFHIGAVSRRETRRLPSSLVRHLSTNHPVNLPSPRAGASPSNPIATRTRRAIAVQTGWSHTHLP